MYICLAALQKTGRDLAFRERMHMYSFVAIYEGTFLLLNCALPFGQSEEESLYNMIVTDASAGLVSLCKSAKVW